MEVASPIPACLALTLCPNCGYSLKGHGREGQCPECGRVYGPGEIVLYGYGHGRYENVYTAQPSRVVLRWAGSFLYFFLVYRLLHELFGRHGYGVLAGLAVLPAGYSYLRRRSIAHPAPVQVRISADGCAQVNDLGGPAPLADMFLRLTFFAPILMIFLMPVFGFRSPPLSVWTIAIMVALLLIFQLHLLLTFFRVRLKRVRTPTDSEAQNVIADANPEVRPTPWSAIIDFEVIKYRRSPYHRLVVKIEENFAVVDVQLDSTVEQAKALVEAVKPWWHASRGEGDGGIA